METLERPRGANAVAPKTATGWRRISVVAAIAFAVGGAVGSSMAGGAHSQVIATTATTTDSRADAQAGSPSGEPTATPPNLSADVDRLRAELEDARAAADQERQARRAAEQRASAAEASVADLAAQVDDLRSQERRVDDDRAARAGDPPTASDGAVVEGHFSFADVHVTDDGLGSFLVEAQVTNTGPSVSTVLWTAVILRDGAVIATADGVANDFASGETRAVEFLSVDDHTESYDAVEFQVDVEL